VPFRDAVENLFLPQQSPHRHRERGRGEVSAPRTLSQANHEADKKAHTTRVLAERANPTKGQQQDESPSYGPLSLLIALGVVVVGVLAALAMGWLR
jgi:hypothetical protein